MRGLRILVAAVLLALAVPPLYRLTLAGCSAVGRCTLGERSYGIHLPQGGEAPYPVLMYLPGAMLSGEAAVRIPDLVRLPNRLGYLTIAPTGTLVDYADGRRGPGWRWHGEAFEADLQFLFDVLDDVATRHRIDRSRLLIAGHSAGGVFALNLACTGRAPTDSFATLNAAFVADQPTGCGPQTPGFWLHHSHAIGDTTIPLLGTPPRANTVGWQAATDWFADLARAMDCARRTNRAEGAGRRSVAADCRDGGVLTLLTRPGAHGLSGDWLAEPLFWFETLNRQESPAPSRPTPAQ